jgi:hypothetical protein
MLDIMSNDSTGMAMMMMMMVGGAVFAAACSGSVLVMMKAGASATTPTPMPTTVSPATPKPLILKGASKGPITTTISGVKYYLTAAPPPRGCFETVVDLQPKAPASSNSQSWRLSVKDGAAYVISRATGICTDLGTRYFVLNSQANDSSGKGWATFAMANSSSTQALLTPTSSSKSNVVLKTADGGYLAAGANVSGAIKLNVSYTAKDALRFSFK